MNFLGQPGSGFSGKCQARRDDGAATDVGGGGGFQGFAWRSRGYLADEHKASVSRKEITVLATGLGDYVLGDWPPWAILSPFLVKQPC